MAAPHTRNGCFCKHCGRDGFTRSEMTITSSDYWLCPDCNATETHVRGSAAFIAKGQPYHEAIRHQLRIVGENGEFMTPAQLDADNQQRKQTHAAVPPRAARPRAAPSPFSRWQKDVLAAATVTDEQYRVVHAIARHATWQGAEAGKDAWPELDTLARETGKSRAVIRRVIAELLRAGWLAVIHRRKRGKQTSNLYAFRWPDGRTVEV